MTYKFKIGQILNFDRIIKNIIENEKDVNIVFKFKLLGIRKAFGTVVANTDVIRNDLIVKYGKEDENKKYSIDQKDEENFKRFVDEMNKFLETEIDIDFTKITMSEAFSGGLNNSDYLVGLYDIIETE